MNEVDQLISKLRNRAGWWEGDENARKILEPLIQARDELARLLPVLSSLPADTKPSTLCPKSQSISSAKAK